MRFTKPCGCEVDFLPMPDNEDEPAVPIQEIPISYCEEHTHEC